MLSGADFQALTPLLVVLGAALRLALPRCSRRLAAGLALGALVLALASLPIASATAPHDIGGLLRVDAPGLFHLGLVIAAALASGLIAHAYLERPGGRPGDFFALLLVVTLGAGILVFSRHFATLFLGLEMMNLALFAMLAPSGRGMRRLDAGSRYLVLAGTSSALLVFGIALIYFETGSLGFDGIAACLGNASVAADEHMWLPLAGNALLLAGLGFRLALAPFHLWAPDVYQRAPAPAGAVLAGVAKIAVLAVLLRYADEARLHDQPVLLGLLELAAVLSIAVGSLLALRQDNIKRLLAYLSIAQLGYLLIAVIAGGPLGSEATGVYMLAYLSMILAAFGVVAALSSPRREADRIEHYRGLLRRRPLLAGILAVSFLSLAGMPLTLGFIAKFYLFASSAAATRWLLLATLVGGSMLGLVSCMRLLATLLARPGPIVRPGPLGPLAAWGSAFTLSFLALSQVWFGIFPSAAMRVARIAQAPASGGGELKAPRLTPVAGEQRFISKQSGEGANVHGNKNDQDSRKQGFRSRQSL